MFILGSLDCISVLIRAGARLNANDCHFGTPLHAATVMNRPNCAKLLLQAGIHLFSADADIVCI